VFLYHYNTNWPTPHFQVIAGVKQIGSTIVKMNYFVFGTNDMPKAVGFYDEIFKGSGVNKVQDEGRMTLWMGDGFMFALAEPFDENDATVGNGTMVGINLDSSADVDLIHNKGLVPVLLVDSKTDEIIGTNIELFDSPSTKKYLADIKSQNPPITIDFNNGEKNLLYFGNSPELKQLQYFPYIQFTVIGLFALIGYLIFSTYRKAEQNQVWAGMAKETAHQLGTPLSSLMAWIQLLEEQGVDEMATTEMQKDIVRLEKVTDRFSKIGSGARLDSTDMSDTIRNITTYLRPRISDKVVFTVDLPDEPIIAKHNASLIEWVIENICKNAVDAMEAVGELNVSIKGSPEWVHIDITDTGKGIPSNQLKTIFSPGFSTKKRGWGLGLSLVKRIVK